MCIVSAHRSCRHKCFRIQASVQVRGTEEVWLVPLSWVCTHRLRAGTNLVNRAGRPISPRSASTCSWPLGYPHEWAWSLSTYILTSLVWTGIVAVGLVVPCSFSLSRAIGFGVPSTQGCVLRAEGWIASPAILARRGPLSGPLAHVEVGGYSSYPVCRLTASRTCRTYPW